MRKPIFIIQLPRVKSQQEFEAYKNAVKSFESDYHILMYEDHNEESASFKMFSDHEIEPIKLEELKELIKK